MRKNKRSIRQKKRGGEKKTLIPLKWIPEEILTGGPSNLGYNHYLSENPNAVDYLEQYPEKIHWRYLSENPNAIHLLEKNMDKINWETLCKNPNAIHLLDRVIIPNRNHMVKLPGAYNWLVKVYTNRNRHDENVVLDFRKLSQNPNAIHLLSLHPQWIYWPQLCQNPGAMEFLERPGNIDNINFVALSKNPSAMEFLERPENIDSIDWTLLCSNTNPRAIELIKENMDRIHNEEQWMFLSKNPNAVEILQRPENFQHIKWGSLCLNPCKEAIDFLRLHPEKINWDSLSINPYAIDLLELNQNMINWENIKLNPAIFNIIDYKKIKEKNTEINKEIIEKIFHPDYVSSLSDSIDDEYIENIEKHGRLSTQIPEKTYLPEPDLSVAKYMKDDFIIENVGRLAPQNSPSKLPGIKPSRLTSKGGRRRKRCNKTYRK